MIAVYYFLAMPLPIYFDLLQNTRNKAKLLVLLPGVLFITDLELFPNFLGKQELLASYPTRKENEINKESLDCSEEPLSPLSSIILHNMNISMIN